MPELNKVPNLIRLGSSFLLHLPFHVLQWNISNGSLSVASLRDSQLFLFPFSFRLPSCEMLPTSSLCLLEPAWLLVFMLLSYFLLKSWILNSTIPCSLSPKVPCSLHRFQVLKRLISPKRSSLWLQLFLLWSVCCHRGISLARLPSSPCLSPSQCTYSSKTWKHWLSCKCGGSELLCNCPSPTGSLVSSFVYLGFWIPLGLPHIAWTSWMLCICFLSFNAHWSWTTHFLQLCFDLRISTSNNLIALSSRVKSGHSYSWCKSTLRSLL